ncbi:glycosyl hydrolases family 18 domain-containing protein [Hirsutella rhossiliensis]|uniref:chitinase n=1 Tax=Hirsutella rhossiliensis TaxID=111463 RepID=A0A9P8MRS4_9HYPO|nr:glycosyl hydrolases family 18 domain-containing protein [Hirsutella rhossiliensis]KAH0959964.1 glycosyl hydrolases family 18 domain-containing protein [Hirsutella rhossiliensis]
MPLSVRSFASVASWLSLVPSALAGFDPGSSKNIAVYWGQNSYGQGSGPYVQRNLAGYCNDSNINIIPIAFMNGITPPIVNFANVGDRCGTFPDNPNLLKCPEVENDIKTCQNTYGKTIVLSLGGATYTQGGWPSTSEAEKAAEMLWAMFGPIQSGSNVDRPFGSAVVNGFDFDMEAYTGNLPAFGARLRSLMDNAGGKKFYLTAAPQCVFPDATLGSTLDSVAFDAVFTQFYNNWCSGSNFKPGGPQNAFNFDVWDSWAKRSKNPNVKVLLGIPASSGAAGSGYISGESLRAVVAYSRNYTSFGGIMMWDMSQLYANSGFLAEVAGDLS